MSTTDSFWGSLKGLLHRIADLAHNLTWASLNAGIRETIGILEPEDPKTGEKRTLKWVSMGDNRVCDLCLDSEGEYDPDDPFLPVIPSHALCRCWWEYS
jgi:hypothetical protein